MYRHILVPLDGSPLAEEVLPHVKALVKIGEGGKVTLLRVVLHDYGVVSLNPNLADRLSEHMAANDAEAAAYMESMVQRLGAEGLTVEPHLIQGHPADAIVDYAEQHDVDLIAMASHGRGGIGRWLLGSVAQKVIHNTKIPTLVIRPKG